MSAQNKNDRREWNSRRVLALRHHLRLTQDQLAARLGTRQQTISEWETGMYEPRGTSYNLLSIVAEQAQFDYQATPDKNPEKP